MANSSKQRGLKHSDSTWNEITSKDSLFVKILTAMSSDKSTINTNLGHL